MSDPIDDMVADLAETQYASDKLADGLRYIYARLKAMLGRPEPIQSRSEASEELTQESQSSIMESSSPIGHQGSSGDSRHHVTHIEHPYCFSEPRNPFVEDMSKDWPFSNQQRTKHSLERSLR